MSHLHRSLKSYRDGYHTFRVSLPKAGTTDGPPPSRPLGATDVNVSGRSGQNANRLDRVGQASGVLTWPRCRVPGCLNRPCKLKSHQYYKRSPRKDEQKRTWPSNDAALFAPQSLQAAENKIVIGRDGVDGLPRLPLDDANKPELRSLFHHFFITVFEQLTGIFRGPTMSGAGLAEHKNRMLAVALSNKPYCIGLITHAHTDLASSRKNPEESKAALALYTKTLSMFHSQLTAVQALPKPMSDPFAIELAMLVICLLLFYDITYQRTKYQEMHWRGMQYLVSLRGGIHRVTVSLAYVLLADRLCAVHLKCQPAFLSPPGPIFRLPKQAASTCGLSFERFQTAGQIFDEDVLEYCVNSSHLAHQWRSVLTEKPGSMLSDVSNSEKQPSLEQLFYTRDRTDELFAVLHAEQSSRSARDMCLVWACRIVEYPITWSNYIPPTNLQTCHCLHSSLREQDLVVVWSDRLETLRWVFFVLTTARDWASMDRDWCIGALRNILRLKYGSSERDEWEEQELELLKSFSWPLSRIGAFRSVCEELDSLPEGQSEIIQMKTPP